MKKRWMIILGTLFITILLSLIALPFLLDINSFRPTLETRASLLLGRKVKFGTLSLSILSGTLVANDVEIADDPAFSTSNFLTAKSMKAAVEMKPLIFSKQINITGIFIEDPQITILQAADGTWNFSNLGAPSRAKLEAGGLKIPPFTAAKLNLDDGAVTIRRLNSDRPPDVYENVHFEVSDYSPTSPFHFNLTTSLPAGGDASLSGTAGPMSTTDTSRTPFDVAIKVNGMRLADYALAHPESGIDGVADLDATLRSDGSHAEVAGILTGSQMKLSPRSSRVSKPITIKHKIEVDLDNRSATITQADIAIGKAVIHVTGTFHDKGEQRLANLQLTGSNMPLDELQPMFPALNVKLPLGSHLQGGTASANLKVTGSMDSLVIKGPISIANTNLVGYNLGSQLGSFASLAGKGASSPDTFVRSSSFDATVTSSGILLENINSDIPAIGTSTGSGTVSPDGKLKLTMIAYPTGGMIGGMTRMASVGGGKGRVPVAIEGTSEKPIIIPDAGATARIMASQTVKGVTSASVHAIGGLFKKKPKDPPPNNQ
jgi:AsmA protein